MSKPVPKPVPPEPVLPEPVRREPVLEPVLLPGEARNSGSGYFRNHFKSIDIHVLPSLQGKLEKLTADQAIEPDKQDAFVDETFEKEDRSRARLKRPFFLR